MEKNIIARVKIKPEFKTEFLELAELLINNTRKEEGTIFYELYEDRNQSSDFVFLEKYKDRQSVDLHMNSPHLADFLIKTKEMFEKEIENEIF